MGLGPEFLARALLPKIMKPIIQPAQVPMTHVNFKRKKKLNSHSQQYKTKRRKQKTKETKGKKKRKEREVRGETER